jgi:prolipoprotein diacylglyceryltransferase
MRTDSLMLGNFKMAQVISIIMIVVGVLIFILKKGKSRFENRYNDPKNTVQVRF